jgi:hypothetical protein
VLPSCANQSTAFATPSTTIESRIGGILPALYEIDNKLTLSILSGRRRSPKEYDE